MKLLKLICLVMCLAFAPAAEAQNIPELRAAAKQGSRDAVLDLVDAYIDGSDEQPRDLKAATQELDRFKEILTKNQVKLRRYLIYVGTAAAMPEYFPQVAIRFDALMTSGKRTALRRTLRLNRNAYIFILERELAARGFHPGTPDARLDEDTLRGILKYCSSVSILDECQSGPMKRAVARALADNLWPREPKEAVTAKGG